MSNIDNLTILRSYAHRSPESLPASILFKTSSKNLTIFDAYPKSIFHFLILPRVKEPNLTAGRLTNLRSLLSADKATAKEVIDGLETDAKEVKKEIEEEMIRKYGFKWDVWMGFHGAPSMAHLHLHVLSADLCSQKVKHKKHYNSFSPVLDFFLPLDDVISWFDAEPSFFADRVRDLRRSTYEPILKEPLACFRCNSEMKSMPALKAHLQEEWNKLERRAQFVARNKRRIVQSQSAAESDEVEEPKKKRAKTEEAEGQT